MNDHFQELEKKAHAATQKIIYETGNKEFKGMRMCAVWQLIEATIIHILTYGAEGWDLNKKEQEQLQTILNKVLKTILFLPQGTPTSILLAETGILPIKHTINRKRIMQAQRINNKKGQPLIKEITNTNKSIWRNDTLQLMHKYNMNEDHLHLTKNSLKQKIDREIAKLVKREIEEEATQKSKINHWSTKTQEIKPGKRPPYMEKLTRKQCNAIIKVRSRMIPVKRNQPDAHRDTACRMCMEVEETQEHILSECSKNNKRLPPGIRYDDIFNDSKENLDQLKKAANHIIETIEYLEDKPS